MVYSVCSPVCILNRLCTFSSLIFLTEASVEVTLPLKDIDAMENDTVTFTCELSKPNRTDGKWLYNEEEITISGHFQIQTEGNQQILVVADITLGDKGRYTYSIENVSTSATLHVGGECTISLTLG